MIVLQYGDFVASVDAVGGRLSGLSRSGVELLAGAQDPEGPDAYRGAVLAPWPNRLADGRWEWEGQTLQVPVNDTATHSALHGLVGQAAFEVTSRTAGAVELRHELIPSPGYPFSLSLSVSFALDADGISCRLEAVNVGAWPAPVGLGVHPYVAAPGLVDDLVLTLPAATAPKLDEQWLETGRRTVEQAGVDFRTPKALGTVELNTAFTDLTRDANGRVEVVLGRPDGITLVLWSGPTCRWLVVYTADGLREPERRRSVAVEPMTCPANALRSGHDLDVVPPGGSLALDWGLIGS
jgi:aldose 1-epimerase